jgi:DNA-directed RNA polymerase specialized sigma24 family protein
VINASAGEVLSKPELLLEFWSYRRFFLMRIHRFISSHDTAEDIFQDACIRFLDSPAVFHHPQKGNRYFCRILHSLIVEHIARQKRVQYRETLPEICCDPRAQWNTKLLLDEVHGFIAYSGQVVQPFRLMLSTDSGEAVHPIGAKRRWLLTS